jgi:hypothetical protein
MGSLGIGTTNPISNLTVQARSLFNDIASFSNSIYQSNITTSNILMGNVSIGTVGISTHKLNVAGNINATSFLGLGSNITNINYNNIYNPPNISLYVQKAGDTMTGNLIVPNLYLTNTSGSSSSVIFSPTPSIYSIFTTRAPWAMYFAEDFNTITGILPNYLNNGNRNATTSGTITKLTQSGNGATGAITYISGGTTATITFPSGSIPTSFTICCLTRYNGVTTQRILRAAGKNWLHGHWINKKGMVFYEGWKTNNLSSSAGPIDNWLCCIGKNGGSIPNNILADGLGIGTQIGGIGDDILSINIGPFN